MNIIYIFTLLLRMKLLASVAFPDWKDFNPVFYLIYRQAMKNIYIEFVILLVKFKNMVNTLHACMYIAMTFV